MRADDGDGRVTAPSALLPGVRTWQLDCEHGTLPDKKSAFEAYLDLLETGTTNLLTPLAEAPRARGAAPAQPAHVRSRPSRTRVTGPPPDNAHELLTLDSEQPTAGSAQRAAPRCKSRSSTATCASSASRCSSATIDRYVCRAPKP